ncbi:MAG TPA: hypothetical protein VH372_11575 [Actinospica sp.]|nr:hypothetical protein [Actinospica sp.]
MRDEHPQVEFLDPEGGHGTEDGVLWLGEEGLGSHRGGLLPPLTTTRRLTGSLLTFVLALALTGFSGAAAYRHDAAVAAAANALILQQVNVGDAVTLTDPGRLGGANGWRIEPSAAIAVGVTNKGPDAITLLPGAVLTGPGVTGQSTLSPAGATVLGPGQSGRLTGTVTVDCGMNVQAPSTPRTHTAAGNILLVHARTASGAVGVAAIGVGQGGDAVREQICREEGNSLVASFFPVSVDTGTHTFSVAVAARSLSAQPLKYWVTAHYSGNPEGYLGGQASDMTIEMSDGRPAESGLSADAVDALLPGVRLASAAPVGPVDGTLAAGANTSAGFSVHVESCPSSAPSARVDLDLEMFLDDHGRPAYFQADGFALDTLVAAACGLVA